MSIYVYIDLYVCIESIYLYIYSIAPWSMSFSFGRALQDTVLKQWSE